MEQTQKSMRNGRRVVTLYVPPDVYARLAEEAERAERAVSNEIVYRLKESIRNDQMATRRA